MKKLLISFLFLFSIIHLNAQETIPSFPGGQKALDSFFSQNTKYPLIPFIKRETGTVKLELDIDKKGNITRYQNLSLPGLSNEFLVQVIAALPYMPLWLSARNKKGKFTKGKVILEYTFSLPKERYYFTQEEVVLKAQPTLKEQEFDSFLQTNIPTNIRDSFTKKKVFQFEVWIDSTGLLTKMEIKKRDTTLLPLINSMKKVLLNTTFWKPATTYKIKVDSRSSLIITFNNNLFTSNKHNAVDSAAKYPLGEAAMYQFIANNIIYPEEAMFADKDGDVYIKVIINKDGTLGAVAPKLPEYLQRGYGLEQEAVRVLKKMIKWKPAIQDGKNIAVTFVFPIEYQIE